MFAVPNCFTSVNVVVKVQGSVKNVWLAAETAAE